MTNSTFGKRYFPEGTPFSEILKAGQPRREPAKVLPLIPEVTLKDLINEI